MAVISVCPCPANRSREGRAPALVELGEDVIEQEQRRRGAPFGQERRLGEDQREDREALLSLRAEAAQVAVVRADLDVVQVRAETRRSAIEIVVEPRLERIGRRRLGFVAELTAREPELVRTLDEERAEQRDRLAASSHERSAQLCDALGPR